MDLLLSSRASARSWLPLGERYEEIRGYQAKVPPVKHLCSFAIQNIGIQPPSGGARRPAGGTIGAGGVGLLPGKVQAKGQVDDRGALGVERLTQGGAELVG